MLSASWLRLLPAALVITLMRIVLAISLSSLIFSGALETYLSWGVAITLVTNIVHMVLVLFMPPDDRLMMGIQDTPGVLTAVALTAISVALGSGSALLLPTALTFITLSALLTGGFLILLGTLKLGNLVRYIPYPVIGGFLAGSGWLLLRGALGVMVGTHAFPADLLTFAQPDQIVYWLPGTVFALALLAGSRRSPRPLTIPLIIAAGFIAFYVGLALTGTSMAEASTRGLLLNGVGSSATWQPLSFSTFAQADWSIIARQIGTLVAICALSAITLLLNVSGIELVMQHEIALNRHLTYSGIANLLSGLLGGGVGFHSLSTTTLQVRLGVRGRIVPIVVITVTLLFLGFGLGLLVYVPRALLGGLLLFLGLAMIDDWLIQGWRKFNRLDFATVLLIMVTIAFYDFLVGVLVGMLLIALSFIFNSSRTRIVHHTLSGDHARSHIERSLIDQRWLSEFGAQTYILELQGFLFFGTANALLQIIRERIREQPPLRYLVLDFKRVINFDSSVVYSFSKAVQLAHKHGFQIVLSNLNTRDLRSFERMELRVGAELRDFPDLDQALEWCEDRILEQYAVRIPPSSTVTIADYLVEQGVERALTDRLLPYMDRRTLAPGEVLLRQGSPSEDLYFIEAGRVSVMFTQPNGSAIRLGSRTVGTTVGELGFYLHTPRSASIIADTETVVYRLDTQCFERMATADPELLIAFHHLILRIVSERMVVASREIAALKR